MYKFYELFDYWVYVIFILYFIISLNNINIGNITPEFFNPKLLFIFVLLKDLEIIINIFRKYDIVKKNNFKINFSIIAHRLFLFGVTHLLPFMILTNNFTDFTINTQSIIFTIIIIGLYLLYIKTYNIDFSNYELENIKLNNNTFTDYVNIRYDNIIRFVIHTIAYIVLTYHFYTYYYFLVLQ